MDYVIRIIKLIISTYIGGCFCIAFGIYTLIHTKRHPQKYKYSVLQGDVQGRAGGYGLIALGVFIIVSKFLGY